MSKQNKLHFAGAVLLCLMCSHTSGAVEEDALLADYDSSDAISPLTILLSHSNKTIKKSPQNINSLIYWKRLPERLGAREVSKGSCYSEALEPSKPYTIKDLLAPALAGLVYGKNRIIGQCFGEKNKECYVEITHSFDESVYGYQIRFKTNQDKIIMDSLFCINTP